MLVIMNDEEKHFLPKYLTDAKKNGTNFEYAKALGQLAAEAFNSVAGKNSYPLSNVPFVNQFAGFIKREWIAIEDTGEDMYNCCAAFCEGFDNHSLTEDSYESLPDDPFKVKPIGLSIAGMVQRL